MNLGSGAEDLEVTRDDVDLNVEVADLAWVELGKLAEVNILPADAPLVTRLANEGV